jgi:RecG-like helicase
LTDRRSARRTLQRWIERLGAPSAELFAEDVRREHEVDSTPVAELRPREVATVAGRLTTVVLHTESRSPSVKAELFDGTGQVELIWLGRRRIVGLEAGTRLTASGRVAATHGGRLAIYNPIYELRPSGR